MVTSIEPHLWTNDFRAAIAWYRRVLDFEVVAWSPDEASANWCQARHGEASIMIATTPDPAGLPPGQGYLSGITERVAGPGGPISLYLRVGDADTLFAMAKEAGAEIIEEIWDAWWGGRQFTVADPDGNWWTVFQSAE